MKTTKFLFLSLLAFNFLFSQQRDCELFLCSSFKVISSFYELNDKVHFGSTSFYFTEINKELKTLSFNSSGLIGKGEAIDDYYLNLNEEMKSLNLERRKIDLEWEPFYKENEDNLEGLGKST